MTSRLSRHFCAYVKVSLEPSTLPCQSPSFFKAKFVPPSTTKILWQSAKSQMLSLSLSLPRAHVRAELPLNASSMLDIDFQWPKMALMPDTSTANLPNPPQDARPLT